MSGENAKRVKCDVLTSIPNEILMEIFKLITPTALVHEIVFVCKKWHEIIDSEIFWRFMCLRKIGDKEEFDKLRNKTENKELDLKELFMIIRNPIYKKEVIAYEVETSVKADKKKGGYHFPSKFGGIPTILKTEEYPSCSFCRIPLIFVAQLRTKYFPETANDLGVTLKKGDHLIRLFFCENCNRQSPSHLSNVNISMNLKDVESIAEGGIDYDRARNKMGKVYPEVFIIGWKEMKDNEYRYDDEKFDRVEWYGQEVLGRYSCKENLAIKINSRIRTQIRELENERNQDKDKLFGYPSARVCPPGCSICGCRMKFFFQIVSRNNFERFWGDFGFGLAWICPTHLVVNMGWGME